jgi:hypothetical protein
MLNTSNGSEVSCTRYWHVLGQQQKRTSFGDPFTHSFDF